MPRQNSAPLSERLNQPVSSEELERRWLATRNAMEEVGIDVLLVQNRTPEAGGYVRWLVDFPALFVPTTIIFPRDDLMTMITHGNLDEDTLVPAEGNGILRGVKRVLTTPSFPSVSYTSEYEAELAVHALGPYPRATIGLVSTSQISMAAGERIKQDLPHATFVEAAALVDPIKAIKSPEEQRLIRATADLQDRVMEQAINAVEPGKRESDIIAVALRAAHELGSEAGVYMAGAGPVGTPAPITLGHLQHRVLQQGDVLSLLIEVNGPGGLYTELGRTCVLGDLASELQEEHEFVLEAQRFTVNLMQPGTPGREVWDAYGEFMRENDRPEERRLHAHGQGCDLVERPLVRFDETMTIEAGMNMACHPSYAHGGVIQWTCDNWLIDADGPGERLHATPQQIFKR